MRDLEIGDWGFGVQSRISNFRVRLASAIRVKVVAGINHDARAYAGDEQRKQGAQAIKIKTKAYAKRGQPIDRPIEREAIYNCRHLQRDETEADEWQNR